MGFETYKRTDIDEEGNPYPLIYMRLPGIESGYSQGKSENQKESDEK
jgi:hypothetical protein